MKPACSVRTDQLMLTDHEGHMHKVWMLWKGQNDAHTPWWHVCCAMRQVAKATPCPSNNFQRGCGHLHLKDRFQSGHKNENAKASSGGSLLSEGVHIMGLPSQPSFASVS